MASEDSNNAELLALQRIDETCKQLQQQVSSIVIVGVKNHVHFLFVSVEGKLS